MKNMWILAQQGNEDVPSSIGPGGATDDIGETSTTTLADGDPCSVGDEETSKPGWLQFLPFIFLFVIMYMLLFRGPRKQKQQQSKMVQTLSKNDKVRTIGGIMGTVVEIKDDEVVIKIDESNNTKMRITAAAIGKNLTQE